jgi:hypothetical protein
VTGGPGGRGPRQGARAQPHAGDLFAVRGRRLAGRVVSTTAVVGPTHGCLLVYLYADARLSREALLAPPLLTTRAPFSHGLFEPLRGEPLAPGLAFERHAFRDAHGALVDEMGRPLEAGPRAGAGLGAGAAAPVGEYRLLEVEAIEALLAASDASYDLPAPSEPAEGGDVTGAVKAILARWTAAFGRPPTRDEWLSLYDVALEDRDRDPD